MSAAAFAEVARCAKEFEVGRSINGRLQLALTRLERDAMELDKDLMDAVPQGNDVRPILRKILQLNLERAGVLEECSANAAESAALLRRSANAVTKLSR